jgi:hypothetical protein
MLPASHSTSMVHLERNIINAVDSLPVTRVFISPVIVMYSWTSPPSAMSVPEENNYSSNA